MSENGEHSLDDTETETKTIEDLPNDSCKSEVKLMNRTDAPLLEDEEMPTYISVSSTSRRDDSDIVNMKQQESVPQEIEEERSPSPYPSDDQAASSVYVLSSGEDTDQHPYNDEDDEDEYGDSDDMENLELDNEFDPEHPNNMKHLMDEEDDDEDDEDEEDDEESPRQIHNDDDDIDGNYEIDYCDGRSDDIILNRRLKNHDKEKSLSLQDLSTYRNNMNTEYFKRRHSHGVKSRYINIPQDTMIYSALHRKQPIPGKYHHVQSKVKLYIKDLKEQTRRSVEKQIKQHPDDIIHSTINNADHKNNDTEKTKPTKIIKDYAERTIKELEIAEECDRDKETYNTSPVILNGQDSKNCLEAIHEESVQDEIQINLPFESIQDEKDPINTDDKMQKQNGTVEVKQLKFNFPDRETQHFGDTVQTPLIQNGHQEMSTVLFNLRTLSYEEYMHGTSDSSQKTDLNRNAHIEQENVQSETYNNAELMDVSIDNEDTTCPLRIENIKSIKMMTDEAKNNNEQIAFDKINKEFTKTASDTSEVTILKNKLNQKSVKYNGLLDAYQKQLMENLKMKQELDELRKSLAKYEKENKPPEQKVASVQTDVITNPVSNKHNDQVESTHVKQSNNKISGSSVASTLSSIDQWSDNNLSISMKPPEVAKTLHSDDSMMLIDDTPAKTTRSLSRAFITSSRILQTLSNITQTKTKPESPVIQNSKRRLSENAAMELQNDSNYQNRPSSSKKRKIADIPEPSKFLQSFKTSQTAAESHLKLNETSNIESQSQPLRDSVNKKMESGEISSNLNISQLGTTASTAESKADTIDDPEDNVKCFVYHEDENSKERSFLILAEEPEKGKAGDEKGRVRECGPYLLGNVEVRMSEINGTINIWGKEISQESTVETENETEVSTKVKDSKKCWQKTPHNRFNGSNLVCSTSKKSKIPPKFELSSVASNCSYPHTSSFNMAKASCSTDNAHADNTYSSNACVSSCEDCDLSKHRKECLRYKCTHSQEKLHSCCIHNVDILEQKCNCSLYKEKQKFEDIFNCSKEKLSTKEHQQSFSINLEPNKHLHENIINPASEESCRYHTACHRSLHNSGENCQENQKRNMSKEACTCEPLTSTDRENSELCNHPFRSTNEEEPLISLKQCSETAETRRRRLSGKRVRGILMDLLRGCGDCYNPNASSSSKVCMHKKEPYLTSCPPQIKVSPCSSPEPSCSNTGQPAGRCCHAYAKRIESQLEEFRVEMERVRSRSDAILNMLNMLHSVETI